MIGAILDINGLTHHYKNGNGGITDITFSVVPGEFLIVSGRNGSGKTTLLRHLNGLYKPHKGEVRLKGNDVFKDLKYTRKTVGMVFQDADTQILGETVFDEVAFGPENLKWDHSRIKKEVSQILEQMDLAPFRNRHPATLSGGEKRRLTIAGILVMGPEIILFDEPFANLDYPGACDLMDIILKLNRSGTTIIMATHDLDLALKNAHRLMILDQGRLAALGSAAELAPDLGRYGLRPVHLCSQCRQEA